MRWMTPPSHCTYATPPAIPDFERVVVAVRVRSVGNADESLIERGNVGAYGNVAGHKPKVTEVARREFRYSLCLRNVVVGADQHIVAIERAEQIARIALTHRVRLPAERGICVTRTECFEHACSLCFADDEHDVFVEEHHRHVERRRQRMRRRHLPFGNLHENFHGPQHRKIGRRLTLVAHLGQW